jgi:nickel/cobalt transporter (NicO) family protein
MRPRRRFLFSERRLTITMENVLLLATALVLGFLHGLGADHLMAIAALTVDGRVQSPGARRARALGVATRFAIGHALLLSCGAGLLVLIGWSIPAVVERGGEMLGGVLLVLMGAVALWGIVSGHVYGHTHGAQPHWHFHVGARDHHPAAGVHSHLPTIIGAAFAISSLRALAMLTPFGARLGAAPLPLLLALIIVFAAGILMSMSLFGVALARVLSTRALARIGTGASSLVGASSVILGIAWIVTA